MPICSNKIRFRHVVMAASSSSMFLSQQSHHFVLPFMIHDNSLLIKSSLRNTNSFIIKKYSCIDNQRIRMFSTMKSRKINNKTLRMNNTDDNDNKQRNKQKTKSHGKNNKSKKSSNNIENELFRAERVVSTRASISRSEAASAITSRKVAYKESEDDPALIPIKTTKLKIPMNAIIYMNGQPLPPIPPSLIVYHKPKNVLSAMEEKRTDRKHLGMLLPETYKKFGMHPVGRLDYDTTGLILFSRNGDLTQRLLHPKYNIEKEYVATVAGGIVDINSLKKKLEVDGVETTEGIHFATIKDVQSLDSKQSQSILRKYMRNLNVEGVEERDLRIVSAAENENEQLFNIRLVVQEGKYRMVRRMLANCNHPVVELKRERHGVIELNDLKVGAFRDCTVEELQWANNLL